MSLLALVLMLTVGVVSLAILIVGWRWLMRRRRGETPARWGLALASIAGVVVVVLPALGLTTAFAMNEWRLARFAAPLWAYPLPPGFREVGRQTDFAPVAQGNLCEFTATRVIAPGSAAAALPLDRVRAHFAPLRLRPAIGDGGGFARWPALEVTSGPSGGIAVTASDAPYPGGFDWRCL